MTFLYIFSYFIHLPYSLINHIHIYVINYLKDSAPTENYLTKEFVFSWCSLWRNHPLKTFCHSRSHAHLQRRHMTKKVSPDETQTGKCFIYFLYHRFTWAEGVVMYSVYLFSRCIGCMCVSAYAYRTCVLFFLTLIIFSYTGTYISYACM